MVSFPSIDFTWRAVIAALCLCLAAPLAAQDDAPLPPSPDRVPIAYLMDMSSGQVLLARNEDRRFIPASITKVMTVFTAFELLEAGRLDERQVFSYRPESFREWRQKGSTLFLGATDTPSVAQLLLGITTVSANDASIVLAEGAAGSLEKWSALMNAKAREIGMEDSHFATPNGWPDEGRTFVTARDLGTLGAALIRRHPQRFASYFGHAELTYDGITQPNHDPLLGVVKGADGLKTGFTNEAGYGFLGTAQRDGRRLIMVVAGADRARIRDRAARDLVEWGFAAFDTRRLFAQGETVAEARVQGGAALSVPLAAKGPVTVSVPAGRSGAIELRLRYDGPLRAPVEADARVAELEIVVDGQSASRVPLYAREDVAEAGFFDRIVNGLAGWVT